MHCPIVVWAMPSGWFRFEQRNLASYLDDFIREGIGEGGDSIRPRQVDEAWRNVLKRFEPQAVPQRIWNHTLASGLLMPALGKAFTRFAAAQVATDQAVIACGLERYRLKNGAYPDKLEQLVPQVVDRLPADAVSGEPYRYALEDGGYKLWSVGWNAKDDGGTPGKSLFDTEAGDWAWRGGPARLQTNRVCTRDVSRTPVLADGVCGVTAFNTVRNVRFRRALSPKAA
jgi:hypothetical protein